MQRVDEIFIHIKMICKELSGEYLLNSFINPPYISEYLIHSYTYHFGMYEKILQWIDEEAFLNALIL